MAIIKRSGFGFPCRGRLRWVTAGDGVIGGGSGKGDMVRFRWLRALIISVAMGYGKIYWFRWLRGSDRGRYGEFLVLMVV